MVKNVVFLDVIQVIIQISKIGDVNSLCATKPVDLVCQWKKIVTQHIINYLLKTL